MIINNDNWIFIGLLITWGTLLTKIIIGWMKPNNDQDVRLTKIESLNCDFGKHIEEIKLDVKNNASSLQLLKDNDIKHIELEMRDIKIQLTEFVTILKERLPSKTNGFKKE